ncbi:eCIS core domain-containing protein [Nostoc sp.]|uniref:eCIS core domain-containing protein n=1 Tax=Nostoc sp. TaxID=1180 RepID=UPI002FF7398F
MTSKRIAQTNQQQKSEKPQESGILQRAAVRPVSDAGMQSTDDKEAQPLSNSAFSKDFSRVPISTTKPQPIMAKLTIGPVGDKYEQEADRVAAQVVQRINAPASVQSGEDETVQRDKMETKDNEARLMRSPIIQRRSSDGGMAATPDLEASINRARGGGQVMANNIRQPMEKAFGTDLSGVKIHTDAQSDKLNRSIQARAFTTGQNVFFRQGEYNPSSQGGQELLAHELTHVVQQNGEAVRRSLPKMEKERQPKTTNESKGTSEAPDRLNIRSTPEPGMQIQRVITDKREEEIEEQIQNLPQELKDSIRDISKNDEINMTLEQAIKSVQERSISGHGGFEERKLPAEKRKKQAHYKLPEGVEVVMYAPDGAWLDNPVANAIEKGNPLKNDQVILESSLKPYYKELPAEYPKTFTKSQSIINYTIKPPGALNIQGKPILVNTPKLLSEVIEENVGKGIRKFHLAVCAVGGVTSDSKYANLFEGGGGYTVVRREDVQHKKKYKIWEAN